MNFIREAIQKVEPPTRIQPWNVMFWEPLSKGLLAKREAGDTNAQTMLSKAQKFLEFNCIKKEADCWLINPVEGFNKTVYKVTEEGNTLKCGCQGYQKSKLCSHVLVIIQNNFMEDYNLKKEQEENERNN